MNTEEFLSHFKNLRKSGSGWKVRCPAHDDQKNSLCVAEGNDGKILLKCQAGCDSNTVLDAVGLKWRDLRRDNGSNGAGPDVVTNRYVYTDEDGKPLFRVCRTSSKRFFQERFENRTWIGGRGAMNSVRRVLYCLPDVLKAKTVLDVEGEKDVESLRKLGLTATTNPGGAGKWNDSYSATLKGKRVAIIPDNDQPGSEHALKVAKAILAVAEQVKIVELPDVPAKGDVSDYLKTHSKAELLALIKATKPFEGKAPELPSLNAQDRNLGRISEAALKILVDWNDPPRVFRRAECISRLVEQDSGGAAIRTMSEASLRGILGRIIRWYAVNSKEETVTALPPKHVVEDILANPAPPFPVVTRVTRAPIFAPDGTLVTKPGYNASVKVYYDPAPDFDVAPVPNEPQAKDVEFAKELIDDLLVDFPFVGEAEKAHAVGLITQPFARELIDGPTPLFMVEKPSPGTGAGLFVDIATSIFLGRGAAVFTEARSEEEWRKRIMAKLLADNTVILIDNVRRRLESSALSAALTAPVFEDRMLGRTEMVGIAVRATWIATGNNPSLSNEMARRTVRIRLDAKVDQPWLREGFTHPDLKEYVSKERAKLVWCVLVLIKDWLVKGRPEPKAKSLGSFEAWTRVIGGIVENAGFEGFLGNLHEVYEHSDAEGAALRAFVAAWWDKYHSNEVTVAQLYRIVDPEPITMLDGTIEQDDPINLDLGEGKTDHSRKIKLGILLSENRDRQFNGKRILQLSKEHHAAKWQLIKV